MKPKSVDRPFKWLARAARVVGLVELYNKNHQKQITTPKNHHHNISRVRLRVKWKPKGNADRSERELANHWVSIVDLREILPFSCSSSSSLLKSILPASRSSFLLGKASGFFESFMNSPSPGRNSTPRSQEVNANAKKGETERVRVRLKAVV